MKKFLIAISILLCMSCEKTDVNNNEFIDITYELQTNVTGFTRIQYGKYYELSNGFRGIQMADWLVSGTGTFTQTESIRKGFVAELFAAHPLSNDWSLKIKSSTGAILKTSTVSFLADSNYYHARIYVSVQ
jgi:hypothetical protein